MKKFLILTGALLLFLSMTYAQVSSITNPNAKKAGVTLQQAQGGSTVGTADKAAQVAEDPELAEKLKAEAEQQQTANSTVSNLSVGSQANDVKALQQQQQEDLKKAEEEKLLKGERVPMERIQRGTKSSQTFQNNAPQAQNRDLWDVMWSFNAGTVNGSLGNFSPFLWEDKLYVAKWDPGATNNAYGKVFRMERSGSNWVDDGSITITGLPPSVGVNVEGFATDGDFIYTCMGANAILKVDPATWAVVETITTTGTGDVDAIAYDAINDHFWVASFQGNTVRRVNRSGAVQQTLTQSGISITDIAWENSTDGTPYLWAIGSQATFGWSMARWDLLTNTWEPNAKSLTDIPGLTANTSNGGGLYTGFDPVAGVDVMIGLWEGTWDLIYCYEISNVDPDAPGPVTGFTVTPGATGALTANLAWTNPSLTYGGDPLVSLTEINIYENNGATPIHTVSNPTIGGTETYTISSGLSAGNYTWSVVPENAAGEGPPTNVTVWIGPDVPGAPTALQGEEDDLSPGDVDLSWTAPTVGFHGGWFDPATLTYTIVRNPGNVPITTGLTATTYTDTTVPADGLYTYVVTAVNAEGAGGSASVEVIVGDMCPITFVMTDAYGDGWNGAYITIEVNGAPFGTVDVPSGTANTEVVLIPPGVLELSWTKGQYDSECGVTVYDIRNLPIFSQVGFSAVSTGQVFFTYSWVCELADYDLMVMGPVVGTATPTQGETYPYIVTFFNNGEEDLTGSEYTIELYDENDVMIDSAPGVAIASLDTESVTINWTPAVTGPTYIYAKINFSADEDMSNNQTENKDVFVYPAGTVVASIGTGTSSGSTMPFSFFYNNSWVQTMYYSTEIGVGGGLITNITYFSNITAGQTDKPVKVYMANTTETDLSAGWLPLSDFTLVYDDDMTFTIGQTEVDIVLDTPFMYSGGNLVILTHRVYDPPWASGVNFYYTVGTVTNRTRYVNTDTEFYDEPTTAGTGTVNFSNIQIFLQTAGLGEVSGTVTEDGTTPVEGATVQIVGSPQQRITESDGSYYFQYVLPGTYDFNASKVGHFDDLQTNVAIVAGPNVVDFVIAPVPRYQVSGTVTDNVLGAPVEGAIVNLIGYDDYDTVTDSNGDYVFPLVWDDQTYTITVFKPGFTAYTDNVTVNGGPVVHDVTLFEIMFPATNVVAAEVGIDAVITWEQTGPFTTGWINYCVDDVVIGQIGYSETAGEDMTMAIRFTPEDFANMYLFDGEITKVALGIGTHMSDVTTMEIRIWEGGNGINNPGTLVWTEPITNFTTFAENTMVEIDLTTPWQIDPSKELRIGWNLVNTAGYPFGRDAGPAVAPGKGDLFVCPALNSGNWVSYLAQYGWSNNISIKAFVSDGSKDVELARGLESYNVYRFKQGEPESAWTPVATALNATTFTDTQWDVQPSGIYYWAVKAEYTGGGLSEAAISYPPLFSGMHEISIGSGTNVLKAPAEVYWRRSFSQTIYTPAELGINGGEISQLTYTFVAPSGSANIAAVPITVWIAETLQEELSQTTWIPLSEFTEVYNGVHDWSAAGTYEVEFTLDVPFQYTGTGNLVIYTLRHDSGGYATSGHGFLGVNAGYPGKTIFSYSDTNTPNPANPSSLGTNLVIDGFPNVKILISTAGMGQIEGIVTNDKGQIVPDATLVIDNMTQISDIDGYYLFPSLQPDTYNIDVTAFAHDPHTETGVVVTADTKTPQNIVLTKFPEVVVTGTITASDGTGPLANVEVTLTGYENYLATSNASGVYTFPEVYANNTYELVAKLAGWETYNYTLVVGTTDPTEHDFVMIEKTYKPSNVVADRAADCSEVVITWEAPVPASATSYILDDGSIEYSMGINPGYNISLGNIFAVGESGEVTSVELLFEPRTTGPAEKTLIADIYDVNRVLVGSSEPFLTVGGSWFEVPLPNVPYSGTFYAMLRWDGSINAYSNWFGVDQNGPNTSTNPAWTLNEGTWEPSTSSGWFSAPSIWMIRVNAMSEGKSVKYDYTPSRVLTNYQIDRVELGEEEYPTLWTPIGTVADNVFTITDDDFGDLSMSGYRYAVRAIHTGDVKSDPGFSDEVWTCDWESTVTFTILTNAVGDPVNGTQVTLTQEDGDHVYNFTANGPEHVEVVWKGVYTITATLEDHYPFSATGVGFWDDEEEYTINLVEIIDEPFGLEVHPDECSALFKWNNQYWFPQYYFYDIEDWTWATRFTSGAEGWKGNKFPVGVSGEVTSVEVACVDNGTGTLTNVTVDIFDSNHQLLGSSPNFQMQYVSTTPVWTTVVFPTPVEFNGDFYAMVHWPAGGGTTPFLCGEEDGPYAGAGLGWSVDAAGVWQEAHVGTTYGPTVLFVRVHANAENGDKVVYGPEKSHLGYNVYLDDVFWGQTTNEQFEFTNLNTGTYTASVEAAYSSGVSTRVYSDPFSVTCPETFVPVDFDVIDAVTFDPILDADIVLTGDDYNGTGYAHNVPTGTYQYLVQKAGYQPKSGSINVTGPTTIPIELEPDGGDTHTVIFNVYLASDPTVKINDATITWDGGPGAYTMMGVTTGEHTWVVTHPLYETANGTENVTGDTTIDVPLDPVSIRSNVLSSVVLYPNPFNNEIIVSNPVSIDLPTKIASLTFCPKAFVI